jgi:hypothetical protein
MSPTEQNTPRWSIDEDKQSKTCFSRNKHDELDVLTNTFHVYDFAKEKTAMQQGFTFRSGANRFNESPHFSCEQQVPLHKSNDHDDDHGA